NDKVSHDLRAKVDNLNIKVESGLNETQIKGRLSYMKKTEDFDHLKNLDLMRKPKVKWAIEGDENPKYFHVIVNNKFSCSRINGIFSNGVWLTNSSLVTLGIYEFYKEKFRATTHNQPHFNRTLLKSLLDFESSFLDTPFTCQEIKNAIWDCGGSKALGPDALWDCGGSKAPYPISLVKISVVWSKSLKLMDLFLGLIPKIQDPLHIEDYRPISLIGVQYKVIAKLLAYRLQQVIHMVVSDVQMAFIKERKIIDVEALHVSLQKAKSRNLFEGIKVGSLDVDISHLQFADDALVIGKWSIENASNLCRIFPCFNLASRLKVNFFKSKLFGVGVDSTETHNLASVLNVQPSTIPFSYLGLPIGAI
nr:putative ribonuclease H protein At1g65750 family [Tanacetum cinerariifolium]